MKHIILIMLTAILFTSPCLAFYPDISDTELSEIVDTLSEFGVISGYPDGTFGPDDLITRSQFSKIICTATLSLFTDAEDHTSFTDVPEMHWASPYIYITKTLGIVNGTSATTFDPEANITYEQAIKMIIAGLGYEPEAQSRGGWPNGYILIAEDLGITDSISYRNLDYATRGDIARLVYNALFVPYHSLYLTESGVERELSDQTLYDNHAQIQGMNDLEAFLEDADWDWDDDMADEFDNEADDSQNANSVG